MAKAAWLKIRADDEELKRWGKAALASGVGFSGWVRQRLNAEPVTVDREALEPQKISTAAIGVEKRSVPRGAGTFRKIVDVTNEVIRKTGIAKKTCQHGVEAGYHCWQCRGMAQVGESEKKKRGRR